MHSNYSLCLQQTVLLIPLAQYIPNAYIVSLSRVDNIQFHYSHPMNTVMYCTLDVSVQPVGTLYLIQMG